MDLSADDAEALHELFEWQPVTAEQIHRMRGLDYRKLLEQKVIQTLGRWGDGQFYRGEAFPK